MSKNIVICSDGTGNTGFKNRGTNVYKLFEAIDQTNESGVEQIAFYDDGVGTKRLRPLKLLGGAFGFGLRENVKQLYEAIARVYEEGDRIYLFGFSRGAFTVRLLSGWIAHCGLIDGRLAATGLRDEVDGSWTAYRHRYAACFEKTFRGKKPNDVSAEIESFKSSYEKRYEKKVHEPDIHFLGVWDTVDAYGLPFDTVVEYFNKWVYRYTFPDTVLNDRVTHARQALAIDDERRSFHPNIWTGTKIVGGKPVQDERIKQVWFPGVHSDVGGGYPKHGLSLISLDWMLKEIARIDNSGATGLKLIEADRRYIESHANAHGMMHNSRSGPACFYQYAPRNIGGLCEELGVEVIVHESAIERLSRRTQNYSPRVLPLEAKVERTETGTVPEPITLYENTDSTLYRECEKLIKRRQVGQRILYVLTSLFTLWIVGAQFFLSYKPDTSAISTSTVTWIISTTSTILASLTTPPGMASLIRQSACLCPEIFSLLVVGIAVVSVVSILFRKGISRRCMESTSKCFAIKTGPVDGEDPSNTNR